jgi:hypothetical protein
LSSKDRRPETVNSVASAREIEVEDELREGVESRLRRRASISQHGGAAYSWIDVVRVQEVAQLELRGQPVSVFKT